MVPDAEKEGVVYQFSFDGGGPWVVSDVIEMAKSRRVPVKTTFPVAVQDSDSEHVTITTTLPAWAITSQGLVAGKLRKVSFAGDACSVAMSDDGKSTTFAELIFRTPLKGEIHGVFVSSTSIDSKKAKIETRKRTFLTPPWRKEFTTLTQAVRMQVDLDGDGVADLRTLVSNDSEVTSGLPAIQYASFDFAHGQGFRS